jgi:hypothetical protein
MSIAFPTSAHFQSVAHQPSLPAAARASASGRRQDGRILAGVARRQRGRNSLSALPPPLLCANI